MLKTEGVRLQDKGTRLKAKGLRKKKNQDLEGNMLFHITLENAEDGWIVAECPALPGCVSQGKDEKEAIENIKEAIIAWLWAEDQKAVKEISIKDNKQSIVVTV